MVRFNLAVFSGVRELFMSRPHRVWKQRFQVRIFVQGANSCARCIRSAHPLPGTTTEDGHEIQG
jgi:hypothetical protein